MRTSAGRLVRRSVRYASKGVCRSARHSAGSRSNPPLDSKRHADLRVPLSRLRPHVRCHPGDDRRPADGLSGLRRRAPQGVRASRHLVQRVGLLRHRSRKKSKSSGEKTGERSGEKTSEKPAASTVSSDSKSEKKDKPGSSKPAEKTAASSSSGSGTSSTSSSDGKKGS